MSLMEKLRAKAMESVANCGSYSLSPKEAAAVVTAWLESEEAQTVIAKGLLTKSPNGKHAFEDLQDSVRRWYMDEASGIQAALSKDTKG